MPSNFKQYRQGFSPDPSTFDPTRILSQAMNPGFSRPAPSRFNGDPGSDPGFTQAQQPRFDGDPGIDPGFTPQNRPQPHFDPSNLPQIPQVQDITPRLDAAMELGAQRDQYRQRVGQIDDPSSTRGRLMSALQGFASSMGSSDDANFGTSFARSLGGTLSAQQGSMQRAAERRGVEEDRQREIEDQFFNRSLKLQDLAQRRRDAEAEREDARLDRGLRDRQIAASERRVDIGEGRLDEIERHNRESESIGRQNANTNRVRVKTGGGGSRAKTPADIDKYAMEKTVAQFGSTPEKIQAMLSTRNKKVTAAYNRYRSEATKSNVDERQIEDTPEE